MKIIKGILFVLAVIIAPTVIAETCPAVNTGQAAKVTVKRFTVTAYCPCQICCNKSDGITASGYKIQKGDKIIAAAKRYPFGTAMNIPGYGSAQVQDRGSDITENCLDVFFPTHQQAKNWGVRFLDVEIYEQ